MEENLSLPELSAIVGAARDKERAAQKFAAALKGIDLDKESGSAESRFEEIERRALAQLAGASEQEIEYADLGFGVEIE